VLGTKRGRQKSDTVLTRRVSKAAKEDLESYIVELKADDLDRTLELLTEKSDLISGRPLLKRLAQELSLVLISHSALRLDDSLRHFLAATRVYPALSDYLVMTHTQEHLPGQQSGARKVHIWPEGDQVGPLGCLQGDAQTLCKLQITPNAWQRVNRGTWLAKNLPELNWTTCTKCQIACPQDLSTVLEETDHYVPFGHKLYGKMVTTVNKQTVAGLSSGTFADQGEIIALAQATYRAMLLPATVAYAQEHAEQVAQRLLDVRPYRELRRACGEEGLESLLGTDDWKDALSPCVPHQEGEEILEATEKELTAACEELRAKLRERAGVIDPATLAAQMKARRESE